MHKVATLKSLSIFFAFTFLLNTNFVFAKYSGGDGTKDNPWKISSKEDLLALGTNTEDYNDCFVMTNDINLTGTVYTTAIIPDVNFAGVFDGNNFKVIGLTIDDENEVAVDYQPNYFGLFGSINNKGKIMNLGLENYSIHCSHTICYAGGLVGKNYGTINNCHSRGIVDYSTGDMILDGHIGGLAGNNHGSINNSYSESNVKGCIRIGGLVGDNFGLISNCFSSGITIGRFEVGGLVGENYNDILNCYSVSDVNGNGSCTGGLIGWNDIDADVKNCFWNVEVQSNSITESIGLNDGAISNVCDLTTTQMQQKTTYTTAPSDWDFINTWAIGDNQTYPYLRQTSASDINQDKKVDYFDLAVLAENWLSGI